MWLLMASLGSAYWWSMTRLRVRLPGPPPLPGWAMRARFGGGLAVLWLAVLWLAVDSPLDRLGDDFLFSAHMVQFLLVTLVSAPLLVAGAPVWLQEVLLGRAVILWVFVTWASNESRISHRPVMPPGRAPAADS